MMQSKAELLTHVQEQLQFIDSSCTQYDAGAKREAKRLAVHVRVLLHDAKPGGKSKSLLTHLGWKERIPFIDGVPEEILSLIGRGGEGAMFTGLASIRIQHGMADYVPVFEAFGLGSRMQKFGRWWNDPRMIDPQGNAVSRQNVMHWLAHKDGGAHVDDLEAPYRNLSRNGSMGVTFALPEGKTSSTESPIPAAMRQIAEEVRVSIRLKLECQ